MNVKPILFLVGLFCSTGGGAVTILQMTLAQALSGSELVFEGRVIGQQVHPSPDQSLIYTYVTFQVMDVIKGQAPGDTVQLAFTGGTLGDLTLRIPDMHVPEVGERGIYFVESLSRQQANPLFGWDQGHYVVRVDPADKAQKVYTRGRRPVTGFASEAAAQTQELSSGHVLGLSVGQDEASTGAMTLEEFKQGLRDRLRQGR
jgi:hypothetical protein